MGSLLAIATKLTSFRFIARAGLQGSLPGRARERSKQGDLAWAYGLCSTRSRDGSHVIVKKKVDLIRPLPGAGSAREAACGPFPLPLGRRRGAKNRLWLHPRDTRLETAEFCVRNRSGSLLLHQPAAQLLTARVIGWPKDDG